LHLAFQVAAVINAFFACGVFTLLLADTCQETRQLLIKKAVKFTPRLES